MAWRLRDNIYVSFIVLEKHSDFKDFESVNQLERLLIKYDDYHYGNPCFSNFNGDWFNEFKKWYFENEYFYNEDGYRRIPFTALPYLAEIKSKDKTGIHALLTEMNNIELDKSKFLLVLEFDD